MSTKNGKKSAAELLRPIPTDSVASTCDQLLYLAHKDYLGARVLLINGLGLQGVTLASTAMEKYLKGMLATKGKKTKTHLDSSDFYGIIGKEFPDIDTYINSNFVTYLGNAYKFRYLDAPDALEAARSIAVDVRKVLAELDEAVSRIETRFAVPQGADPKSRYITSIKQGDTALLADNHILLKIPKSEFLSTPSKLCCLVIDPRYTVVDVNHEDYPTSDDGVFDSPKVQLNGATITLDFASKAQADRLQEYIDQRTTRMQAPS